MTAPACRWCRGAHTTLLDCQQVTAAFGPAEADPKNRNSAKTLNSLRMWRKRKAKINPNSIIRLRGSRRTK